VFTQAKKLDASYRGLTLSPAAFDRVAGASEELRAATVRRG
jgi:hypothetical protein